MNNVDFDRGISNRKKSFKHYVSPFTFSLLFPNNNRENKSF